MKHSDFQIGTEFFTGTGRWRCTDVGSRVITAISLEPRQMVRMRGGARGDQADEIFVSNDPLDFVGPPYMVAEHVFDEYDLDGCCATKEEIPG